MDDGLIDSIVKEELVLPSGEWRVPSSSPQFRIHVIERRLKVSKWRESQIVKEHHVIVGRGPKTIDERTSLCHNHGHHLNRHIGLSKHHCACRLLVLYCLRAISSIVGKMCITSLATEKGLWNDERSRLSA